MGSSKIKNIKTVCSKMSTHSFAKSALSVGSKSLLVVAAINVVFELKTIRFDRKSKRITFNSNKKKLDRLKNMLKQFAFIFGQVSCFNLIISLNSKKWTLPLGVLVGLIFSEFCDVQIPLLVSSYIMARIGALFVEKGAKLGIIKNESLIYKVLFVLLMGTMNIYIFAYPDLMPRRVYKNYMKIGRLTDVDRLQFDLISGREPIPAPF